MLRTNLTFLSFIERFCAENLNSGIIQKTFPPGFRFVE
ncbi:MAG: Crp/Fnr family transcriptional regulator, partial [Pedobacter sp.]